MESAYFDTIANTSRESVKAIEQLRYKYIISLAWVCRSIQASRQLRRFWLFMHEQALKRRYATITLSTAIQPQLIDRSRFPYSLSFEPEFEDSCAYLELPYSVETNFKAIPPRLVSLRMLFNKSRLMQILLATHDTATPHFQAQITSDALKFYPDTGRILSPVDWLSPIAMTTQNTKQSLTHGEHFLHRH